jgi:hypothetical protein
MGLRFIVQDEIPKAVSLQPMHVSRETAKKRRDGWIVSRETK